MLKSKYSNDTKKLFNDIDIMIRRLKAVKELKFLEKTKHYKSFEGLNEANTEVDVYGAFSRLYSEAPELFDFEPIMYHTQDGIDYLVKLDKKLYEELEMPRRMGTLSKTVCQELGIVESRYSYVEFKHILGEQMNHSLELVSHIVCWRKKKGFSELRTNHGVYKFNKEKDELTNEDGNTIKVVCLRKLLKEITKGTWVSKDAK